MKHALPAAAVALLLTAATDNTAQAALGGAQDALEMERVQLKASARTLPGMAYNVVEMVTDQGATIRQFVRPDGTVFAVSWKGPFKPDLRQLLGAHFDTYQNAPRAESGQRSRTHSQVVTPELVVVSAGHPRAFTGLAYLRQLLPAGVDPAGLGQ
jgi:hypothetical protein